MTGLLLAAALAATAAEPPATTDIDLRSETLVVEHAKKQAVFGGGVTAVRGGLVLRCPTVVALYDDSSRVKTVTCDGPVTASDHGRTMTAGKGTFDILTGTLLLEGEPTLVDGERRLVGELLTYVVATGMAELTRARATLPSKDVAAAPAIAGRGPLAVQAEKAAYDLDERTATFAGAVTATRGDLVLHAPRLVTHLDEQGNVERAVSGGGRVTVVQRDRRATAGKAVFLGGAGKLVLEGEPEVTEKDSSLAGEKVTFLLGEDRVEVEKPRASFPLRGTP